MTEPRTVATKITKAKIKDHQKLSTFQLTDVGTELRLRFHKIRLKATWYIVHKERWHWIGYWPSLSIDDMRGYLPQKLLALNANPNANIAEDKFTTMAELLADYANTIKYDLSLDAKTRRTAKSIIKKHLLGKMGHLTLDEINKAAVKKHLVNPLKTGEYAFSTIEKIFGHLKTAFSDANGLELVAINPIADLQLNTMVKGKSKPVLGKLVPERISGLLDMIQASGGIDGLFVTLVLLNGNRIGETRVAQWGEFNFDERIWRIADTKTDAEHLLPLTDLTIAVLKVIYECHREKNYQGNHLFSAKLLPVSKRGRPRNPRDRAWNEVDANNAVQRASNGEFTCQHLRKLARTLFEKCSGDWATSERLINHSLGKMDQTYVGAKSLWSLKVAVMQYYHEWLIERDNGRKISEIIQRSADLDLPPQAMPLAA